MSLIPLGILAASGAGGGGSFESIATVNGTGSSTSVTFSSIPSTYQHLQIRILGKSASAGEYAGLMRLNGDSGNNYAHHNLEGNGSTASANATTGNNNMGIIRVAQSTDSNIFGVTIIDIHDYASTTKNKVVRSFSGADANAANTNYRVTLNSGLWLNTAAITSITLLQLGNWSSTSTFALYGIKGA